MKSYNRTEKEDTKCIPFAHSATPSNVKFTKRKKRQNLTFYMQKHGKRRIKQRLENIGKKKRLTSMFEGYINEL